MTEALKKQVGGGHYKKLAIQPVEYITKNNLSFIEGSVVKYVTRWKDKNGVEDLKKAIHLLEILIEMQENASQNCKTETTQEEGTCHNLC